MKSSKVNTRLMKAVLLVSVISLAVTLNNCSNDERGASSNPDTTSTAPDSAYAIIYDGNGNTSGSVPVDSTGYREGETVAVLGNTGNPGKTCLRFAGWNTLAEGSGTSYSPAQTFIMGTEDVKLYSQWEIPRCTISGTINGLSGTLVIQNNGTDDLTITENGTFTLTLTFESGSTYSIVVVTQPGDQSCEISGAAGTIAGSSIDTAAIWCYASAGGSPVGGYPSWQERAVQVLTNAVRKAPQDYIAAYTSFSNILFLPPVLLTACQTGTAHPLCILAGRKSGMGMIHHSGFRRSPATRLQLSLLLHQEHTWPLMGPCSSG